MTKYNFDDDDVEIDKMENLDLTNLVFWKVVIDKIITIGQK